MNLTNDFSCYGLTLVCGVCCDLPNEFINYCPLFCAGFRVEFDRLIGRGTCALAGKGSYKGPEILQIGFMGGLAQLLSPGLCSLILCQGGYSLIKLPCFCVVGFSGVDCVYAGCEEVAFIFTVAATANMVGFTVSANVVNVVTFTVAAVILTSATPAYYICFGKNTQQSLPFDLLR